MDESLTLEALKKRVQELELAERERARLEAALKESEARYREIVQSANSIILRMDTAGNITFFNDFAQKFFGYDENQILGRNVIGTIVPTTESSGRDLRAMILDIGMNPKRYEANENENMLRDGKRVWISWTNKTLRDASGNITEILCIGNDITRTRQAIEDNRILVTQLRQAQKLESVGRLAGGVAHDFNNMLGVIYCHVEMAMDDLDIDDPLYQNFMAIKTAANRSSNIVRQLLAFASKQVIHPKNIDINETISKILSLLKRLIGENIELLWQPGMDAWTIRMDPTQMDQILANLLVNARDAIAEFGKITISTANKVLDKKYCQSHIEACPGEYLLLTVADTGIGMEPAIIEQIFEPFFTTKDISKGTGLGLATVYGIMKQNKGFIDVSSRPGSGTTFMLYFPRALHEVQKIPQPPEIYDSRRKKNITLLVVEDEKDILYGVQMYLERYGYHVLSAETPSEAIAKWTECDGPVHLLITDVILPEMNGKDLYGRLQRFDPNLKCIYLSGYTDDVIARHGVMDHGVHLLLKPFSMKQLMAKINEIIEV